MTPQSMKLTVMAFALTGLGLGIGGGIGYWSARHAIGKEQTQSVPSNAKVLYWYDPMKPDQHFDKPGKSPFMDMQLIAKYADGDGSSHTNNLKIDPSITQNLGIRVVPVTQGLLKEAITVSGSIQLNDRLVAVMQARSNGFVERVYARAAGDIIARGAPIADLLVPDWAAAQIEYLTVLNMKDPSLIAAARQRLQLLGMPVDLITRLEKTRQKQATITLTAPIAGLIQNLDVRTGMTLNQGQTLAKINGLESVWLEAAVPEAEAGAIRAGNAIDAQLTAYPLETFRGKVIAVLPDINIDSRTLRVRIELPNAKGLLKPGMFAQVQLHTAQNQTQLLVPEEAVIRTGTRNIIIVALAGGHFQPVEVQLGSTANGQIAVIKGLQSDQKVVASGQFLIDSEASLQGVLARMNANQESTADKLPMTTQQQMPALAQPVASARYQSMGKVESISTTDITISHQPIPAIGWGAMTMTFKLPDAKRFTGIKIGDLINFGFNQNKDDYVIATLDRVQTTPSPQAGGQP